MAASVWMKCWNWPLAPGSNGAVLGGDDAGGDGLRERKGAADGFNPVAHLRLVGVAELHGRQSRAGVDLDHGEVGGLVDADDARRAAEVLRVGIGGELDVDLVGLLDDVIVGDDVALGVDDEAGAERLADLAVVAAILIGHLAAEESVEEVLEVILTLLVIVAAAVIAIGSLLVRVGQGGRGAAARRGRFADCLGSVCVLILTTAGPTSLAIFTNSLGAIEELMTFNGVASLLAFCFSCPRTPCAAKEPATIASESVASTTNVETRRRVRSRSRSKFIGSCDLVEVPALRLRF